MLFKYLYIGEKPSVGRAIADSLADSSGVKIEVVKDYSGRATHIVVGNIVVSWVFGHILEQAEPEDYNPIFAGVWADCVAALPLVPVEWKLKPVPSSKDQLLVLEGLIKKSETIVHAGDPDREGQLLVDEVLEFLGNTKPVKRILPNAIDEKSMKKILANMVENSQFKGLYKAGLGRQRADWLIGMNMSRACSISNQKSGMRGTLSVGRVQTPTLSLIVRRDLEIENFKSQAYFEISSSFVHPKGNFQGKLSIKKDWVGLDSEGRIVDPAMVAKIKGDIEGKTGQVTEYKVEDRNQSAPLPYSLSALQKKASEAFKMGAKKVLEIAQSLYEKKVATYPRTDCQYLPEDQFSDAGHVLASLSRMDPAFASMISGSNVAVKSNAWNSKKVTAHHAIVPTGSGNLGQLTDPEKLIFGLLAKQFIAQFYQDYQFKQTSVGAVLGGYEFKASGRTPTNMGWKKVFGAEDKTEDSGDEDLQLLPPMAKGDVISCSRLSTVKKQTKAPARFTEGTLIHAMTNVHETVSDPELKKKLKEVKGIGTEATRGDVIETLKDRMFVSDTIESGKIVSTPAGRAFIKSLPKDLTNVSLTAMWENALDQIERGTMTLDRFIDGQAQWIKSLTKTALESKIVVPVGFSSKASAEAAIKGAGEVCPACKVGTMRVSQATKGDNAGYFFFSCSAYPDCKHTMEIPGQTAPGKIEGGASDQGSKGSSKGTAKGAGGKTSGTKGGKSSGSKK